MAKDSFLMEDKRKGENITRPPYGMTDMNNTAMPYKILRNNNNNRNII